MVTPEDLRSALSIYRGVASESLVAATVECAEVAEERSSIYSAAVVIWLMIFQRLSADRTLGAAIEHLKCVGVDAMSNTSQGSIKARHGRISDNTGGYSQGRERVAESVVERVTDALNAELSPSNGERRIYCVDGTTVLVACSEDNVEEYSQHGSRIGPSHYPLVRVELATDAMTGVASRPVIGAHNGSKATSEITLVQEVLGRLEPGSIVVADRLYGVTQVIHSAQRLGLHLVVRLKDGVAARLIGGSKKAFGDVATTWQPSAYELKRYPHLAGVAIAGRCVWTTVTKPGFEPFKLYLFTTCDEAAEEVVRLYGLRWNVEQDLRDLKSTLEMNFINAKSPAMIRKEIVTGVAAYNLIRHFMKVVAKHLKTPVRTIGFKLALRKFRAVGGIILSGFKESSPDRSLFIMLRDYRALKIPARKKTRPSQPRQKWRRGMQNIRRAEPFQKKKA